MVHWKSKATIYLQSDVPRGLDLEELYASWDMAFFEVSCTSG